jgi:chorismate mutase
MSTPVTVPVPVQRSAAIDSGRGRIDEIDAEIVRLVRERVEVSRQIQRARRLEGGPRIAQARENEVVGRWSDELGAPGATVALALLELSRGPLG